MITNNIIVIDIGGTNIRTAIYSKDKDEIFCKRVFPTSNYSILSTGEKIVEKIFIDIETILKSILRFHEEPCVLSVAFAGPVDKNGLILSAPTIWGDLYNKPISIASKIKNLFPNIEVVVTNDMTAGGYGFVSDKNKDFCVITVSSGVGLKVFLHGHPIIGPNERGGETGHLQVDFSDDAPVCDCGGRGHLGAVASGRSTQYHLKKILHSNSSIFKSSLLYRLSCGNVNQINNEMIAEAFHTNDMLAKRVVENIADPMGRMIGAIHLSIGIEKFIITGGFSVALGEKYRKLIAKAASLSTWSLAADFDKIITLGTSNIDAVLIGAGRLACAVIH